MRGLFSGLLFILAVSCPLGIKAGPSQLRASLSLAGIFQHLDANAATFRSLTADVARTKVTVIINDRSTESGKLWVRGEDMRLELTSPDVRTILRRGDKLYIYTAGLKRVEEYDLGKHRDMVDEFLQLGFGTSGGALQQPFMAKLLGESSLDGRKTAWLELSPKSDDVRKQFSKIQLWLDENTWLAVEQKFFEAGSDDYFEVHYSNVVRNPRIDDSRFTNDWPAGTKKFTPPIG